MITGRHQRDALHIITGMYGETFSPVGAVFKNSEVELLPGCALRRVQAVAPSAKLLPRVCVWVGCAVAAGSRRPAADGRRPIRQGRWCGPTAPCPRPRRRATAPRSHSAPAARAAPAVLLLDCVAAMGPGGPTVLPLDAARWPHTDIRPGTRLSPAVGLTRPLTAALLLRPAQPVESGGPPGHLSRLTRSDNAAMSGRISTVLLTLPCLPVSAETCLTRSVSHAGAPPPPLSQYH